MSFLPSLSHFLVFFFRPHQRLCKSLQRRRTSGSVQNGKRVIATGMKEVGFKTLRILSTIHQPVLLSARNLTVKNMDALITSTFNIDGSLVPVTSRFDGKDFLEKLEGKKIMFIGDSVSLNHYESLLCLLHAAVPDARITTQTSNSTNTVTFEDHGVSISVFQTHYLVDIEQEQIGRVLKLESIKDGNTWKDMDVLVFNTWLWWYRRGPKQPWDYVQEGQSILKDMDRMVAFQKGLTTWAKWVDSDVDTSKTTVIFQGISPFHYHGEEWDEPGATNCGKETEPVSGSSYPGGSPLALQVVEDVLSTIKKPVHLLNITTLSQLRKDGHPSSYNGFKGMDCTHWCVAGVPDTWNELLYTAITS